VRVRIRRAERMLGSARTNTASSIARRASSSFFDGHDELYWNVTGNGWEFVIARASARVRLPQPVPADQLSAKAYTGPQGARGHDATASVAAGEFLFETTRALAPNEGLTIVAMFPKGIIAAPTQAERMAWVAKDNAGELVGTAGVAAVLAFLFMMWWRSAATAAPAAVSAL
jgi:hypothetical protein